jgi:hypothetical protein
MGSNHPYLFQGAEDRDKTKHETTRGLVMNSGKMVLLDKLLTKLKADGHRVLIFSQMVRLLDIISDYMVARGFVFQRLDGTVPSEARKKSIQHFNAPDSPDFAFLLSTRAGGLGINLETANTVIIFDVSLESGSDEVMLILLVRLQPPKRLTSDGAGSSYRSTTTRQYLPIRHQGDDRGGYLGKSQKKDDLGICQYVFHLILG